MRYSRRILNCLCTGEILIALGALCIVLYMFRWLLLVLSGACFLAGIIHKR